MTRKLYLLSGVFMIGLVIAGLWATKAGSFTGAQQTVASSPAAGPSLEAITQASQAILTGTVRQTKSQWLDRNIYTTATVEVSEEIKGATGSEVSVAWLGGAAKKGKFALAMTVADQPQMYANQRVFLFLSDKSPVAGSYSLVGSSKGLFTIGQTNGDEVVTRNMTMAPIQKGTGLMRGNPSQAVRLSEFRDLVRSYLK
jgi:hypothetical protein